MSNTATKVSDHFIHDLLSQAAVFGVGSFHKMFMVSKTPIVQYFPLKICISNLKIGLLAWEIVKNERGWEFIEKYMGVWNPSQKGLDPFILPQKKSTWPSFFVNKSASPIIFPAKKVSVPSSKFSQNMF